MKFHVNNAERVFDEISKRLAIQLIDAVPDWVRRCVLDTLDIEWRRTGGKWLVEGEDEILRRAEAAGWRATREVGTRAWALRRIDDKSKNTTPLEIVRDVVVYPTTVLREAGIKAVERDCDSIRRYPADLYNLTPRSLADLHPLLPPLEDQWKAARTAVWTSRAVP